jgi:hypothetical protein
MDFHVEELRMSEIGDATVVSWSRLHKDILFRLDIETAQMKLQLS